jgi:hypothetical protein
VSRMKILRADNVSWHVVHKGNGTYSKHQTRSSRCLQRPQDRGLEHKTESAAIDTVDIRLRPDTVIVLGHNCSSTSCFSWSSGLKCFRSWRRRLWHSNSWPTSNRCLALPHQRSQSADRRLNSDPFMVPAIVDPFVPIIPEQLFRRWIFYIRVTIEHIRGFVVLSFLILRPSKHPV